MLTFYCLLDELLYNNLSSEGNILQQRVFTFGIWGFVCDFLQTFNESRKCKNCWSDLIFQFGAFCNEVVNCRMKTLNVSIRLCSRGPDLHLAVVQDALSELCKAAALLYWPETLVIQPRPLHHCQHKLSWLRLVFSLYLENWKLGTEQTSLFSEGNIYLTRNFYLNSNWLQIVSRYSTGSNFHRTLTCF